MNIAELGIKIDSADAIEAKSSLEDMAKAGGRAEKSMVELEQVLSKGAKTTQELAKQRDALAKLTATAAYGEKELAKFAKDLDKSQLALAKSAMEDQKALNSLLGAIDPARAALAKLDTQVEQLGKHLDAGRISQDQYNSALGKIDKDYAKLEKTTTGFDKLRLGTRQAQENVVQLGNALSSGDWGSGVRAVAQLGAGAGAGAAGLLAILAPLALATAAVGGLAVAYYKGSEEQDRYNKSLALTGNYAGTTSSALGAMARQVGDTVGTTGAAAEVLAQLAGSGKIVSSSFEHIAVAALSFEKATGKAASETVSEFVKLADDPVKAVVALNDKYNFLTAAVYTQIRALQEQGDTLGAQQLAESSYADALIQRADTITSNLGTVESAWKSVKEAAKGAWDAILDIGREDTFDQKFEKLADRLNTLRNAKSNPMILGDNPDMMMLSGGEAGAQNDITSLLQKEVDDQAEARRKMFQDQDIQAGTKAYETLQNNLDTTASKSKKLTKTLEENQRRIASARQAGYTFTPAEEAALEKQTRDKFKDPKTASTQVDLTAFNSAKNNLADIVNDYKNAQKELEAAQKAGLVSQGDYATRSAALIKQESVDVAGAYGAEISALEATKAKKSTTAAQSIQLDQRIADARQSMVKAQKDADSQLDILAKSEIGRQKRQTASLNNYVDALNLQTEALRNAGQRAVLGVGMGDRQNALNGELNAQGDRYASASRELANQRSEASLRGVSTGDLDKEFGPRVDALAKQNQQATEQIKQNYADLQTAQGDWTKGATSAWENYLDSAQNVAGQTKSLFGNAFNSMEDAVVNFAMTGKLSFADFTKSILADMARIATRQAASGALGALFGAGASAAGSYFGGSTVTSTSGFSDYGQITSVNAKGNVFDGPGISAYSNSVVSSPTIFPFAKGTGLMGEAGPEAIMPLTRTSSGKLGVMAAGGGGGSTYNFPVSVSVDVSGDPSATAATTPQEAEALGKGIQAAAKAEAQAAINKGLQQGGPIWQAIRGYR